MQMSSRVGGKPGTQLHRRRDRGAERRGRRIRRGAAEPGSCRQRGRHRGQRGDRCDPAGALAAFTSGAAAGGRRDGGGGEEKVILNHA